MEFLLLILSLPTENGTVRQRAWRALKGAGAAVLRDGVYLMPDRDECATVLQSVAAEVAAAGGSAQIVRAGPDDATDFRTLFDRSADYAALLAGYAPLRGSLGPATARETGKQLRKLRKAFNALSATDYFPGESRRQAEAFIEDLERECERLLTPGEPQAVAGPVARLSAADHRGRVWATRRRPWVDRLASAWLIRRFIDREARFVWIETPEDCPAQALGFDFDGAAFSHVGQRVTFETLLASFGLDDPALQRLAGIVHVLDVGGLPVPEAAGLEAILSGLRTGIGDDDSLLDAATLLFDGLYTAFLPPSSEQG